MIHLCITAQFKNLLPCLDLNIVEKKAVRLFYWLYPHCTSVLREKELEGDTDADWLTVGNSGRQSYRCFLLSDGCNQHVV